MTILLILKYKQCYNRERNDAFDSLEALKKNVREGMTAEESRPLIEFLCNHATRPQFCYRHVWQKDDLVVWDNRCLMHNALGDYDRSQARDMERTTVIGKPSGYIYEGPVI